jgi:hypothetical protein
MHFETDTSCKLTNGILSTKKSGTVYDSEEVEEVSHSISMGIKLYRQSTARNSKEIGGDQKD